MKTWKLLLFLTFVSVTFEVLAADEIHWTIMGLTSVTFDWRGEEDTLYYDMFDATGDCLVTYSAAHSVTAATPSPLPTSSSGPFREAKILGLTENKRYCYAIGAAPGGASGTFKTPLPRGSSGFTVYAEGDIGSSNSYPGVVPVQSIIAAGQPDFVLVLGDLSYGDVNGADDVDQHFNDVMDWSRDAAYMAIWGNHDWHTSASTDQLNNYEGRFDFPNSKTASGASAVIGNGPDEDWYWFDYGNVRFIAYPEKYDGAWSDWRTKMRSNDPNVSPMRAAQNDSSITFIVTFGHRPAYFSGSSTLKGYLDGLALLYSKYVLNLSGHDHDYDRTDPTQSYGVTHLLVGTGGEHPMGALRLRFNSTAIRGDFINTAGVIQDTFNVAPGDAAPPTVSITSPVNNTGISGTVTVSADADDGAGGLGVAGVQFKLDGTSIGTEDTASPYTIAWNSTTVADGVHTLSAQARDFRGNIATTSINVTVDNNTSSTLTFAPMADATIKSASPGSNYGSTNTLTVDNSPAVQFLIKFDVSGLAGRTVTGAKLRLYNVDASGMGGNFFRVADNSWTERGVNWNNAPAPETPAIASLGTVSSGSWHEVTLPLSLITNALSTAERVFSLRVQSTSSNNAVYSTKENTSGFSPQLVVDVQ